MKSIQVGHLATDDECFNCGESLIGDPIPDESRVHYGNATHFKKVIGVQYDYRHPEHYDGVSEWMCPHCKIRQGRWSGKILKKEESERRFGKS